MEMKILDTHVHHDQEIGYTGKVVFRIMQHKQDYEITLHSKDLKEWGYSLHFFNQSGSEEQIDAVNERIEDDDVFYQQLIIAVKEAI